MCHLCSTRLTSWKCSDCKEYACEDCRNLGCCYVCSDIRYEKVKECKDKIKKRCDEIGIRDREWIDHIPENQFKFKTIDEFLGQYKDGLFETDKQYKQMRLESKPVPVTLYLRNQLI